MNKLYPTHIPTNSLQKAVVGIGSALASIMNPARGDMVAAMGEATATTSILKKLHDRMANDVCGRQLLLSKPRIIDETIDKNRLRKLPDGTLGREYARLVNTHGHNRLDAGF
jgi:ubiquinone biosynthesis protein COQ4